MRTYRPTTTRLGIALALALFVSASAQEMATRPRAQSHRSAERVSVKIEAATVWLGMTKQEARQALSSAGVEVADVGEDLAATPGTQPQFLRFKNNRLIFAEIEWYRSHTHDAVDAVLGALTALAEQNDGRPCEVSHALVSQPDLSSNRVYVMCGDRSVRISKTSFYGKGPGVTVTQRIGDWPPPK